MAHLVTVVLFHQRQREIDAGGDPRRGPDPAVPSSTPAAPSTKAPVQIEARVEMRL